MTAGTPRVLLVEDSPALQRLLVPGHEKEGFAVDVADDGEAAVELTRQGAPDVILLDLGLPKLDGMEVCRHIRRFSDAYIVMLTARESEADRVEGLASGADDYVVKPFSPREVVARIHAMLRRPRGSSTGGRRRQIGDLVIDVAARDVTVAGVPVELTRIEFDLLDELSRAPGTTRTRAELITAIWGDHWHGDDHVVDVHISKLRQKLGDDPRAPRYVITVRGVGFRSGQ